ncbi:polysaccharide deacetylase family protein [uncultured Kushneria sp.]|jgi:predicted deacetylase|uniref:polysaccharide deacetylase family protein n=1 Tax=uncultured Kushneria sp. TaxID=905033 RepID=UPI00260E8934|nr:polysaccharide deacetylase family protein [uncultured Kushneria sp.]
MADREFALVLHDIAPATWPDYRSFVEQIDGMGQIPMTWLVVPDFHHRSNTFEDAGMLRLLHQRMARGDELALHGFYHCDDAPPPRTPRDYFMRRLYTYEGEFYPIGYDEALQRLERGAELFRQQDWPLDGFVAPAWLLGDGARRALRTQGFTYTSDPDHLYRLPDYTAIKAPSLVWSARSRWRRGMSWVVNERARRRHRHEPLIRLGLHPVDMRHDISRRYWIDTIRRLLDEGYQPTTKISWLHRQSNSTPESMAMSSS